MQKSSLFNFQYSYLSLPEKFYSLVRPEVAPNPELFMLNKPYCKQLEIATKNQEALLDELLVNIPAIDCSAFAQAYAGHQFGYFTKLGDGRALIVGEHVTKSGQRFDLQLKGSGKTPYSRGGDGKATLKAMLREYLISEAMHHLNIPTSRSLAVVKTGELIYREYAQDAAVLVRVMKSHIRVGTFEFAARFGNALDLKALIDYTAKRLYPEIVNEEHLAESLLRKVMSNQIDLVVNWMRVGFIHGVMNTDNTSISAETFDYGPCAFMNYYDPATVYSSIDQNGRYAFGNQPMIIKWNIARFAETLLPFIHENQEKAIARAQIIIDEFDRLWRTRYYETMLKKIGINITNRLHNSLVDELLDIMEKEKMDYNNTFRDLQKMLVSEEILSDIEDLQAWVKNWKHIIGQTVGTEKALKMMQKFNPFVIPRNHLIENTLNQAVAGNLEVFETYLQILSKPYQFQENIEEYLNPSASNFDSNYRTFCGT